MTIFVEDKLKPGLQNTQLADAVDIEFNIEGEANTSIQSEVEALKTASTTAQASTQTGSLIQLTYTAGTLGPNAVIELASTADLTFIPLMSSATQEGTQWVLYNNTSTNRRIQLEEVSGTVLGNWFGDRSFSGDLREVLLQPQETCRVTAFEHNAGTQRFKFDAISTRAAGINSTGSSTVQVDLDNGYSAASVSGSTLTLTRKGGGTTALSLPNPSTVPTILPRREDTVLANSTADNTYVVVDEVGTSLITITLPDVTSGDGKRVGVINARPDVDARVRVIFASGDTLTNAFENEYIATAGQAVTFMAATDNNWVVLTEGEIELTPNFPSNPSNDENTFMFSVNGNTPAAWTRDRNTTIQMRTTSGTIDYQIANPSTSGITVSDGDGYIFQHTGSGTVHVFPFEAGNTMVVGGVTVTSAAPYTVPNGHSLVLVYDTTDSRWEGRAFASLVGQTPGVGGSSGADFATEYLVTATNNSGATIPAATPVQLIASGGVISANPSSLANPVNGITQSAAINGEMVQVILLGAVVDAPLYVGGTGSSLSSANVTLGTEVYWDSTNNRATLESLAGTINARSVLGTVLRSNVIEGGDTEYDYFFNSTEYIRSSLNQFSNAISARTGTNTSNIAALQKNLIIPNTINATTHPNGQSISNATNNLIYRAFGGTVDGDRVWTLGTLTTDWTSLQSNQGIVLRLVNAKATTTIVQLASGTFEGGASTYTIQGHTSVEVLMWHTGTIMQAFIL